MPIKLRRCWPAWHQAWRRMSQFARRLAENGCQVDRAGRSIDRTTGRAIAQLKRFTNQPHREWIYRQAYQMGRHVIGYEVQKVLAAVDWFTKRSRSAKRTRIQRSGWPGTAREVCSPLQRGRSTRGSTRRWSAAISAARACLGGADLPQRVGAASGVRRRRDRQPDRAAGPGRRVQRGPRSRRPAATAREGRAGAAPGKLSTPARSTSSRKSNAPRHSRLQIIPLPARVHSWPGGNDQSAGLRHAVDSRSSRRSASNRTKPLAAAARTPIDRRADFDPPSARGGRLQELVASHPEPAARPNACSRRDSFWRRIEPRSHPTNGRQPREASKKSLGAR